MLTIINFYIIIFYIYSLYIYIIKKIIKFTELIEIFSNFLIFSIKRQSY